MTAIEFKLLQEVINYIYKYDEEGLDLIVEIDLGLREVQAKLVDGIALDMIVTFDKLWMLISKLEEIWDEVRNRNYDAAEERKYRDL
jgi:hypothetical protein